MLFDGDDANIMHLARHDITPDEAEQVLRNGPVDLEEQWQNEEDRITQAGETNSGRILTIVSTTRNDLIRIITGWNSEAATKRKYLAQKGSEYGFRT